MFASEHVASCRFFWAVSVFALLSACGDKTGDSNGSLEAIDVAPSLTVATEDDPRAVVRPPELTGILPEDFPTDLPLFLPASLIDFGSREQGYYVSLLTPASVSKVDQELSALVQEAGWSASNNADGSRTLRKGSQQLQLRIEDARPGTLYQFDY